MVQEHAKSTNYLEKKFIENHKIPTQMCIWKYMLNHASQIFLRYSVMLMSSFNLNQGLTLFWGWPVLVCICQYLLLTDTNMLRYFLTSQVFFFFVIVFQMPSDLLQSAVIPLCKNFEDIQRGSLEKAELKLRQWLNWYFMPFTWSLFWLVRPCCYQIALNCGVMMPLWLSGYLK